MALRVTKADGALTRALRQLGVAVPAAPHKHRAKPTEVHGKRFASQLEANYYAQLVQRQRLGEIDHLETQPRFALLVTTPSGVPVRIGEYRADFRYRVVATGETVVVDTKGQDLAFGKWKRRHAEAQYGIAVQIVNRLGHRR